MFPWHRKTSSTNSQNSQERTRKWVFLAYVARYFLEASKGELHDALTAYFERKDPAPGPRTVGSSQGTSQNVKTFRDLMEGDKNEGQNLYAGGKNSYASLKVGVLQSKVARNNRKISSRIYWNKQPKLRRKTCPPNFNHRHTALLAQAID
jgi:hypothetical protein